jgi:NAD(P)-dependent dehydrogenase (short-subunit alcohol dehydrogenase family)
MSDDRPDRESLHGRHVLVTGAGRGIGRACALELARRGATVALSSRTSAELDAVHDEVRELGGRASALPADATDREAVRKMVEQAEADAPLWGCVHAAGVNRTGPTVDYAAEDFDLLLAANVRSTFLVFQAVGARLVGRGGGRLVAISSQMGAVGYPGRAAYCASKHAVNGLVRALAVEWAPSDVTVNAVAPTFVETDLTRAALADAAFREDVERRLPAGRIGTVDELTGAIAFMLTPGASLITGAILAIDGGWTAW